MKKLLTLSALAVVASSCQFPKPMTRADQLTMFRATCLDYGFDPGTDAFAHCVEKQDNRSTEIALEERRIRAIEDKNWIKRQEVHAQEERNRIAKKKSRK